MSELPDPLEDFLQHPPTLPIDLAAKDSLARQTASILPRPRPRRWPMTAAIAASILVTLTSAYFFLRPPKVLRNPIPLVEKTNDLPQPQKEKPKPPVAAKPIEPRELEWAAFDAADDIERVRLYFRAGDLYLDKHADFESAVRCYAQAIRYSNPRDLQFNPDDNWLVMALKRDHEKEN